MVFHLSTKLADPRRPSFTTLCMLCACAESYIPSGSTNRSEDKHVVTEMLRLLVRSYRSTVGW